MQLIFSLACLSLLSCKSNPTVVEAMPNGTSSVPEFNYTLKLNNYLAEHKEEVKRRDINQSLDLAKKSIGSYLVNVGAINECSKFQIDSPNIPNAKRMAEPIDVKKAKKLSLSVASEAMRYAKSNNSNFNWTWGSGNDIKKGKESISKKINMLSIEPIIKYAWCQEHVNKIKEPVFTVNEYRYEIKIDRRYLVDVLVPKVRALNYNDCKKHSINFNYLPSGFSDILANTINTTNIVSYSTKRGWSPNDRYTKDLNRYDVASGSMFKSLPCNEFKKEYYSLLSNAPLTIEWFK